MNLNKNTVLQLFKREAFFARKKRVWGYTTINFYKQNTIKRMKNYSLLTVIVLNTNRCRWIA